MIIILSENATDPQVDHIVEKVAELGLETTVSRGTYRTVIGVIGDETKLQAAPLEAIPGVAQVVPVLPPYKLASREAHPQPTTVEVGPVKIGGGYLALIAGPCAVESLERMDSIARSVRAAGDSTDLECVSAVSRPAETA